MTEDPEVRQLVDDDRLEGLRRGEDEPPAEHQAALPRRAAPAASRIADRHGARRDRERGGVTGDLGIDDDAGPLPEPRLEDPVEALPIARDQRDVELVLAVATDPGDDRATGPSGDDPQTVQLAAVADRRAVGETTAGRELRLLAALALEMPTDPGLAAAEEILDHPFRVCPPATGRRWHGHDEPVLGVDRDREPTRAGRSTEDVRRHGRSPDPHRWPRMTRPGSRPVSAPPRTAASPPTITCSMPSGHWAGASSVAVSMTVAGSRTTRSAIAPSRTTPRSRSPIWRAGTDVIFAFAVSRESALSPGP